jgi:PadR family transcriptional regulator, regulatory protein PadR
MAAPRMTTSVLKVVAALLADPAAERYGLQIMQATGLPSGTLYPILVRLERAGWVESRWEDIDPVTEGRPIRRYYRLTSDGTAEARREVAAMHEQMGRATGPLTTGQLGQPRRA